MLVRRLKGIAAMKTETLMLSKLLAVDCGQKGTRKILPEATADSLQQKCLQLGD